MIQQIIAFGLLIAAMAFLIKKFFFKKKKKNGKNCDSDCGCH